MMRMKFEDFTAILREIVADITPRQVPKGGHKVISVAERLTLTLRFLATGETFRSLSFQFRISRASIPYIVKEVCQAAWTEIFSPLFIPRGVASHCIEV